MTKMWQNKMSVNFFRVNLKKHEIDDWVGVI